MTKQSSSVQESTRGTETERCVDVPSSTVFFHSFFFVSRFAFVRRALRVCKNELLFVLPDDITASSLNWLLRARALVRVGTEG